MSIKNSTTGALAIAPPTPKASTISRYKILFDFVTLPPRNICTALNPCRTHSHRTSPRIARISLLEERGVSRPHRLCTAMHRHAPPCTASARASHLSSQKVSQRYIRGTSGGTWRKKAIHPASAEPRHMNSSCGIVAQEGCLTGHRYC